LTAPAQQIFLFICFSQDREFVLDFFAPLNIGPLHCEEIHALARLVLHVHDQRPADHSIVRARAFARVHSQAKDRRIRNRVCWIEIAGAGPAPPPKGRRGHMAQAYRRFSTHGPPAAYRAAAARLCAGAAEAVRRRLGRSFLALIDGVRGSEDRSSWSEERLPRHLPGSVFDARYQGLTAQATYLDAGICRQARLR
jgi:hypothetical protein